jgi:hypothetical protein
MTDGQTDMTKLIVAFRNFTIRDKNSLVIYNSCVRSYLLVESL